MGDTAMTTKCGDCWQHIDSTDPDVMVDEEGEDEWCWEDEFELTDDAVILPPIEQVAGGIGRKS